MWTRRQGGGCGWAKNWATDADVASLLAVNIKFANGDRSARAMRNAKQTVFDITPTYPQAHTHARPNVSI